MQKDDFIAKKCRVCGKTFEVLHPSRWAYKKGNGSSGYKWYCSWGCVRKEEKEKERVNVRSVMPAGELHKKAMEICIEGGDPIAFLKEHGSVNPEAMWWQIRNKYKKMQNELYDELPQDQKIACKNRGGRQKKEKPAEEKTDFSAPPAAPVEMTKEEKPKLRIMALESQEIENAEWRAIRDEIMLYKDNGQLSDSLRIVLTAEGWLKLCDEIRTMLDQFGVKEA